MYRAAPLTQRDGSELANANCRVTGAAVGIDFHTLGAILSSGAEMRSRQSDQVGGTDSHDCAEAWATYGQELLIRDGRTFDDALADLEAGRSLQLDVWHATTGGPCLSGSGAYGHDLAIAPERNGDRWLVNDPWCSPPAWEWWPESALRAGAEKLGSQSYSAATGGRFWPRSERELLARMRAARNALYARFRPDDPAETEPPDTGGSGGRIFYTATRAQGAASPSAEGDMAINAAEGLTTAFRADVPAELPWFEDQNLTRRKGAISKAGSVWYVGQPIGEAVEGGARAILVNTANLYGDGSTRPSIVYVAADAIDPYRAPSSPPSEVDEAIAERDELWREWLLDGAPSS